MVLCVDDHAPGLTIRKLFLESFGYAVETAESGPVALQKASQRDFDAVVLDYRMPGMNGLELGRTLRQRFPALPLIFLSGYAPDLSEEMHRLASSFVPKGSNPDVLLDKLAEVLGRAPRKTRAQALDPAEVLAKAQEHIEESKRQVQRAREATSGRRADLGRRRSG